MLSGGVYMFALLGSISSNSWASIWFFFELNLLGVMSFYFCNFSLLEFLMKYFIVQSLSSLFFLWWAVAGYKEEVVALLFFFKLGVGPFHFWLLSSVFFLKEKEMILFLGLQKSFLCVLSFFIYVSGALVVVLMNFVLGAYLAFSFFKIWYLLFSSSFIHFGWLLVFMGLNLKSALVYYFYYVGALSFMLLEEVGGGLMFFVYMGVPFSPLFFMKWSLFTVFSWSSLMAVGAVSVIIFFIYLRGVFYLLLKAFNKFMFVSYSLLYYFILGLFIML